MTNHEQDDWGDDGGLRPQLDAYADARLRADPEARARSRARVMAEARAASDAARVAATAAAARLAADPAASSPAARSAASPAASPVRAGPRRRLVFGRFRVPAAVAATLLLVGALTVGAALAGSGPSGPFYAARLWVEELTLPTDADARAAARLAHLETRLAEAASAAEVGNGAAVAAALDAYRAGADAALSGAGGDPSRREHLAAQLGRHVAVLEALVPRVPVRASEAIQDAINRTELRIREILVAPPDKPEATPPPEKPHATPKPTPPGKPLATPGKPPATPKPTPPGKPEATPGKPGKPEATPKPTPPGKPETPPGKPQATLAP